MAGSRNPPKKKPKGQVSIMVALMIVTFLTFFSFITSVGLLVNAKINIQNAADLAAYAGAAVQARQLNQISFLNYEMRRQFKKFLFRYYVVGNMAQKSHPNLVENNGLRQFTPDLDPTHDYQVPAVCIIFNGKDNFCQVNKLQRIPNVTVSPLDGISGVLNQNLAGLEQIRKQNCVQIGETNKVVLLYWLYNTDPELQTIEAQLQAEAQGGTPGAQNAALTLRTVRGLSAGLGLYPRNVILLQRIKTLQFYLNFKAASGPGMKLEQANELNQGASDPAAYERTLQAFYSAFYTLGQYSFSDASIELTELLPRGTNGAALFNFNEIRTNFETYYISYPGVDPTTSDPQDCDGAPTEVRVRNLPVGISKNLDTLTYYAVRLRAQLNLPVPWPFRNVTLTAYSAAQPFGSRIGPQIVSSQNQQAFVRMGVQANPPPQSGCPDCIGVPNLPIIEGEALGSYGRGWYQSRVIAEMFQQFQQVGGQINQILGPDDMARAYQAAMAPNPPERARYNVINDIDEQPGDITHEQGGDPFIDYFDNRGLHTLWAPILSPEQQGGGDPAQIIENEIRSQISTSGGKQVEEDALVDALQAYIGRLRQGQGEDAEGFLTATLRDPLNRAPAGGGPPQPITMAADIMIRSADDIKTSWSAAKNQAFADLGRVGYSVKYVPFDVLLNPGKGGVFSNASGSGEVWGNLPEGGSEFEEDSQFLKH